MGNVKFSQGLLDESEHYHRKALAHYQSTIGNDHHRTADVCHRVAQHCIRRGEIKQARYPVQMPYVLEPLLTYLVAQNAHRPSAKDLERGQNGVPQRDCPDIIPQGKGADPAR